MFPAILVSASVMNLVMGVLRLVQLGRHQLNAGAYLQQAEKLLRANNLDRLRKLNRAAEPRILPHALDVALSACQASDKGYPPAFLLSELQQTYLRAHAEGMRRFRSAIFLDLIQVGLLAGIPVGFVLGIRPPLAAYVVSGIAALTIVWIRLQLLSLANTHTDRVWPVLELAASMSPESAYHAPPPALHAAPGGPFLSLSLQGQHVADIPLEEDVIKLGSLASAHVRLEGASRLHAVIEKVGSECTIIDLGSDGGTRVNGVNINKQVLHPGDVIEIGAYQLVFTS